MPIIKKQNKHTNKQNQQKNPNNKTQNQQNTNLPPNKVNSINESLLQPQ